MKNNRTGRVEMIFSSAEHIRIELVTPELLAEKLNAFVSEHWPSGEYNRDAMAFFCRVLKPVATPLKWLTC
jgi:[ribosomal protein S5]-alanine N-acetyltransferase